MQLQAYLSELRNLVHEFRLLLSFNVLHCLHEFAFKYYVKMT